MLVQWPAKCHGGLFGHAVQAVGSQGVCADRALLRVRQEGCGQAIRAGGREVWDAGGSRRWAWARGGPVLYWSSPFWREFLIIVLIYFVDTVER